ncbi:MAG: hypothetical protein ACOYB1_07040 [Limnohabitans sp.]
MRIAQLSAKKDGLGRPFFSGARLPLLVGVCLLSCSLWAQAQGAIYRCGQEYTNAPSDKRACVRLVTPGAVTVIEGTHVNSSGPSRRIVMMERPAVVPAARSHVEPERPDAPLQRERDTQARTIVLQELEKARQQQAQLLESYKQAEREKSAVDASGVHASSERLTALKAAIERNQRDIDSLQRELARRSMAANP